MTSKSNVLYDNIEIFFACATERDLQLEFSSARFAVGKLLLWVHYQQHPWSLVGQENWVQAGARDRNADIFRHHPLFANRSLC